MKLEILGNEKDMHYPVQTSSTEVEIKIPEGVEVVRNDGYILFREKKGV